MPNQRFFADRPEDVGIDSEKLEALFDRAEREVREGLLPSAQIAVARHGKLAAMRSFGRVRHEGREAPATNDTLYCIFSATKAITSAAAWLLIQEGKLSTDERVADIVPEFGSNGKDGVLVEQLLTHTAGFPHAPFLPTRFLDVDARRAYFHKWRLVWEPGSRFEYHPSSSMYVVAELIERRSGLSYGDFTKMYASVEALRIMLAWTGWRDVVQFGDYRPGSEEALFLCRKTHDVGPDFPRPHDSLRWE